MLERWEVPVQHTTRKAVNWQKGVASAEGLYYITAACDGDLPDRSVSRNSLCLLYRLQFKTGETLVRYLIVLLAIAGMVVSVLALKVHYDTGSEPCRINDKWDCGVVNHSPYAVLYGMPVAAIGIAGYLVIGILGFMRRRGLLLLCVLAGMAFALYLTHIEASVLEVWCLYCVISQGIMAVLMLVALAWMAWARIRRSTA
jgi:vitamin-K-epoxide reductase (warfarin-sensitive)